MVYGINSKVQEFGGMYCAILTVNSYVVSAGIIRILGVEVTKIPIVATSSDWQGKVSVGLGDGRDIATLPPKLSSNNRDRRILPTHPHLI
ncbi:hypothetical protein GIB67_017087 [Kingdonia uniflora]|uniref:Increased DNA methylation 1 C-terminal domain-containing protein n=1 Tax=Kingdonia uniflora TaxID=39325 RepID=A0A7J7NCV3_9MAGN|nr:hypothetical protein GIB67_017087 [Kingdonia uniflora]